MPILFQCVGNFCLDHIVYKSASLVRNSSHKLGSG
jgi:hypothetical protein